MNNKSSTKANGLDPITTQVVRSTLVAAAEEMRLTMVRTAYSPLLYEIQDFGVAILNTEGEMLAQGTPHEIKNDQNVIDAYLGVH